MEPRPRVALVAPSLLLGGLERMVRDLALGLAERGYPTSVFLTGPAGVYADGLEQAGIGVWHPGQPRPRIVRVPVALLRELARYAPAIIHGHSGTWMPCAVAKAVLGFPRLVFTDHGRYAPEPRARALIERHLYHRQTNRLVAVSTDLADYLHEYLRLPSSPQVIPNGIDLGRFDPGDPNRGARLRSDWGVTDDEILVIAIGRLEVVKNHLGLLTAVAQVRASGRPVRLAIVGTGRLKGQLRGSAERLGIREHTLFLGHRRDVPDCLHAADIFASASTSEGLPLSLLEAMAAGLPVVSTAVGGIPEALGDPPAGVLVPAGDSSALAAAIMRLVDDPKRRDVLAGAAHARSRRYSLESCVERYCDLYDTLLADPAAEGDGRGVDGPRRAP